MSVTICPVCGSSTDICSVQDVIYSGTSVSRTQGVNIGMFGSDEFSQMYFTTTTVSRLAQLLSPPRIPLGFHWFPILALTGMGYYTIQYTIDYYSKQPESGLLGIVFFLVLGFFFSIFIGTAMGALAYVTLLLINIPNRRKWRRNCDVLLTSRFCQKDGVVIDSEGRAHSPSNYVDVVFS